MPAYARSSKKPYRKRTYKKRPITAQRVAQIARKVAYKAQPIRECRMHFFKNLKTSVLNDSFSVTDLSNISIGDNVDERHGKAIYITGAKFNFSAVASSGLTKPKVLRVILCRTVNRDGDLLDFSTWTDLYQSTTFGDRTADALVGDITFPLNTDIIQPLYDKTYRLMGTNTDSCTLQLSKFMRIGQKIVYDDDGATAQPINGKLYLIIHLCEAGTVFTVNEVSIDGLLRIFFRDSSA